MSISFATKISTLRREKNITQKAAAEDLGISQALLSHYEKGIRECNLDFVVKASLYYDVSTDYLLGLSETKHNTADLSEDTFLPSDSQINSKTVLRSLMFLQNIAETESDISEDFFNSYFTLMIKKYISIIQNNKKLAYLCDISMPKFPDNSEQSGILNEHTPEFLKTINSYASELINHTVTKALK